MGPAEGKLQVRDGSAPMEEKGVKGVRGPRGETKSKMSLIIYIIIRFCIIFLVAVGKNKYH